jgi:biopolymer transport protein ExbD
MKKWLLFSLLTVCGVAFASLTTSCRKETCPAYRTDDKKVDDDPPPVKVNKKGQVKRKKQKTFY